MQQYESAFEVKCKFNHEYLELLIQKCKFKFTRRGRSMAAVKHLKCFFDWWGKRQPSQPAKSLAALEDLDGFADLPAAVVRDCQNMFALSKGD